MKFKLLISAIENGEDFLLERLYKYATEAEYTKYSSTKEEDWRIALRKPSEALVNYLKSNEGPDPIHVDENFKTSPIASFGILEAKRHRERGIKFEMFFGLAKLIRQSFVDLVYEMKSRDAEVKLALATINRFFDKFELGLTAEWISYDEGDLISDLQKSNRELTNRKNRYLTLFKSLADPAFVVDKNLHILEVNEAFINQFGEIVSEFIGKEWSQCFNNEFVDAIPLNEIIIQSSTFEGIECKVLMRNEEKYVICSGSFLNDITGKYAGGICIIKDISKSKKAEEELKKSEESFRILYNNSPEMYVSVSPGDATIVMCNETLLKETGYMREELIGSPIFTMYHKDCMDEVKEAFQQFVESGLVQDKELILKRKDGSKIDVSLNVNAVRDENGKIQRSISSWRDITERKQTEESLKIVEERLNVAYKTARIGRWELDLVKNQLLWDQGIFELFEINPEKFEATYEGFIQVVHPDDRDRVKLAYTDSLENKVPYEITHRVLLKGDRIKHVIEKCNTEYDNKGKPVRSIGIVQDITENAIVQEALAESEYKYRTIIERSSDMIWMLDTEGRFVFFNENVRKVAGLNIEEWIGKSFIPMIFEDELQMLNDTFQKGMEGESSSYLMHFKKEDGEVLTLSVNTTPIKKDSVVTGLVSFAKDITVDLQLQKKIQSYKKLFEDSKNEIYFFHIDSFKFFDVNKAALNNLGFTENEMYALTPIDIIPDFNKKNFDKLVQELKNHKKKELTFSAVQERKNGSTYPIEVHLQLLKHGDIPAYVAIILDITDRVKAEHELKMNRNQLEETVKQRTGEIERQSKKLEESQLALTFLLEDMNVAREKREETNIKLIDANKDLESFSYSVSHDLRAPLRAIVGFSAKFNSQYNTIIDDEGKRLLAVISKNAMKMGRLIDDLLTFSRMSRTEIRKLNVNMRSLADEAWLEVAEQASGRNIQIEFKALPDFKGDRNMLKQVYVNLLSNAIKFSKPVEQNVIEVGADVKDGKCIFYVKDNGVGFDMKYIEKLFLVFQRLHSEKEFEGSGVGLALVHRIIKKHEGEIWAESELDKGAKFSFRFPS